MIPMPITPETLKRAKDMAKKAKYSRGKQLLVNGDVPTWATRGYLGELAFHRLYPQAQHVDIPEMDFKFENWVTVDVKASNTNGVPNDSFDVQVYDKHLERCRAQLIAFAFVKQDFSMLWMPGFCERNQIERIGEHVSAGRKFKWGTVIEPGWFIPVKNLRPIRDVGGFLV